MVNHVAKYKEITCKDIRKYKKVREGGLADQEMGPWGSINSSIVSSEINFKCSQKQLKNKIRKLFLNVAELQKKLVWGTLADQEMWWSINS